MTLENYEKRNASENKTQFLGKGLENSEKVTATLSELGGGGGGRLVELGVVGERYSSVCIRKSGCRVRECVCVGVCVCVCVCVCMCVCIINMCVRNSGCHRDVLAYVCVCVCMCMLSLVCVCVCIIVACFCSVTRAPIGMPESSYFTTLVFLLLLLFYVKVVKILMPESRNQDFWFSPWSPPLDVAISRLMSKFD
jgi:hypothetical protein